MNQRSYSMMDLDENDSKDQDCAICLQKFDHPTRLPCGHVFCFLCVKGLALTGGPCALCRAEIPNDYLDQPVLLENTSSDTAEEVDQDAQWFYEGKNNGWWKYDGRSNIDLEKAYKAGKSKCTLMLAGALYKIKFKPMVQMKKSDKRRLRRVKRSTPTSPAKGY